MTESPVAIVTGAGSGVGRAIAIRLIERGCRVVLVGRTGETLDETQSMSSGRSMVEVADVGVEEDRARIIQQTIDAFGRVDILVNNAGLADLVPLDEATTERIRQSVEVNAIAPVDLAARVLGSMKQQQSGCIVNISTYSTLDPFPGLGMYGCSKGAMNVLCRAIVNEYASAGVRAYTVALGATETAMLRSMFDETMLPSDAAVSPDAVAEFVCGLIDDVQGARSGSVVPFPPRDDG
jgi:NAD(P)-dependent dehydrogenase (short-subunit alcohol dehydrogenase family)